MFGIRRFCRQFNRRLFSTERSQFVFKNEQHSSIFRILNDLSHSGYSIKYPYITIVGNQSGGKTSLVEGLCGIDNFFLKEIN